MSPKTIEKKLEKAGKDLAKGAKKAGDAMEDKAEEVGKALGKGAHNLKKGIEKEKDKLERVHRG